MKRLAKGLYGVNSVTNIVIGLMHTLAHYKELTTSNLSELLDHEIVVTGIESNVYDLWQGMSLMMGYNLIFIGILHLYILYRVPQSAYPPVGGSIIMIVMLLVVIYAGLNFFSAWQVYGGVIGIIIQSICLILSIRR